MTQSPDLSEIMQRIINQQSEQNVLPTTPQLSPTLSTEGLKPTVIMEGLQPTVAANSANSSTSRTK